MERKTRRVFTGMLILTGLLGFCSVVFFLSYQFLQQAWMLTLAITALTCFYHFAMRLIVGEAITCLYRKRDFPQDGLGFRLHSFEDGLYRKLKVVSWKKHVMTAKPELFDLKLVTPQELLHNVMQAELVHRIIMVLSFVPLLLIIPFGEPWVFIITSTAACLVDCVFVIVQRYNRPTVLRYLELSKKREERKKQIKR